MPKGTKTILMILLVLYVVMSVKVSQLYSQSTALEAKEENLKELIQSEEERRVQLEEEQEYRQSLEYIEELAREKLGLIKPNEILLLPKEE